MDEYTVLTETLFSGKVGLLKIRMNGEIRESRAIKMRPSILWKAHLKAIEQGKTLGRWIEDTIEEKIDREERVKAVK